VCPRGSRLAREKIHCLAKEPLCSPIPRPWVQIGKRSARPPTSVPKANRDQFTTGSELLSRPSSALSGVERLTPPTKPIAFPLRVPSVTLSPNFFSLSIAAYNLDDLPSLFVIFPPIQ
jgi:hypothetical protein